MKGGLYVAILLTALLCGVIVSDDIANEDETELHHVYSTGDEINDDAKELSDSEVNDELNSILNDNKNPREQAAQDSFIINDKTEINKSFKTVGTDFRKKLFGEYATEENYNDESLFSAEDLNYEYADDRDSNEFKAGISDDGKTNKEETRRPNLSLELGVEEIFSSDEYEGWDNEETKKWASRDKSPTLVIEKEKARVRKEDRGRVRKEDQKEVIGRGRNYKENRRQDKEENKLRERDWVIKKEGRVSLGGRGWIGNELHASDQEVDHITNPLNSSTFILVNHYFCMTQDVTVKHLVLYGSKAWEFPLQDVNLTLTYPTVKPESAPSRDSKEAVEYIITGFKVILYVEGAQTRGYITDGGILQDKLSMTFIISDATALFYKFWLYGTPKTNHQLVELHNLYYMCS